MIRRTRRACGGRAGGAARNSARVAAGSSAVLLIVAGCGHSSSASSGATPASSARAPTGGPAQQTAAGGTSGQPPASSTSAASGTVTGSSGQVTATLRAGTHRPKANHAWPVHFTVTRAGSPAKASVAYQFLFAGQVVAHRSHYTFTGRFSDIVVWPSASVGYPLTFRAVIVSEGATIHLDYPVQVGK